MIGIIDYKAGNTGSWKRLLNYLNYKYIIIDNPRGLDQCDKIILPGVGAFDSAVRSLHYSGLFNSLINQAKIGKKLLGVCLGMQLLFERSCEGELNGLGLINAKVKKLTEISNNNLKIPHVGFNRVYIKNKVSSDFLEIANENDFYFVHSYAFSADDDFKDNALICKYENIEFTAGLHIDNIYCTQFHPEKSGDIGIKLTEKFLDS